MIPEKYINTAIKEQNSYLDKLKISQTEYNLMMNKMHKILEKAKLSPSDKEPAKVVNKKVITKQEQHKLDLEKALKTIYND